MEKPIWFYDTEYDAARAVCTGFYYLGWTTVAASLIGCAYGLSLDIGLTQVTQPLIIIGSILIALGGLLIIAGAQITLATVDNADHTRKILYLLINKKLL